MRFLTLGLVIGLAWLAPAPALAHQDGTVSRLLPDAPVLDVTLERPGGGTLTLPGKTPLLVVAWSLYDAERLDAITAALTTVRARHPRLPVIGLNLDSRVLVRGLSARVQAATRARGWTFPQVLDPLRYSRDALGLLKTPAVLLLVDGRMAGSFSFSHPEDAPLLEALIRAKLSSRW